MASMSPGSMEGIYAEEGCSSCRERLRGRGTGTRQRTAGLPRSRDNVGHWDALTESLSI